MESSSAMALTGRLGAQHGRLDGSFRERDANLIPWRHVYGTAHECLLLDVPAQCIAAREDGQWTERLQTRRERPEPPLSQVTFANDERIELRPHGGHASLIGGDPAPEITGFQTPLEQIDT